MFTNFGIGCALSFGERVVGGLCEQLRIGDALEGRKGCSRREKRDEILA